MNLSSSLNFLRQVLLWVWRGKYHVLAYISMIIMILYIFGGLNFYPNIVSFLFSITGLAIILALQILNAKKFADHTPNTPRNWIMSFPKRKPKGFSIEGSVSTTSGENLSLELSIADDATIENKVGYLMQQVTHIKTVIGTAVDRIEYVDASLTNMSKEIETKIDNIDTSLKTIIAGHIVGNYDLNLFGIIITICGTLIMLFRT